MQQIHAKADKVTLTAAAQVDGKLLDYGRVMGRRRSNSS
jgi:hypothetical protein